MKWTLTACVATLCLFGFGTTLTSAARTVTPRYSYQGSVEHFGRTGSGHSRFYDGDSLVANLVLKDNPGAAKGGIVDFEEPEVAYIMAGRRTLRHDRTRRTLEVYEMEPGKGHITWNLGSLPVGTYMMRIIGAIATEDVGLPPKQLVFEMQINDGRNGETNSYVLRGRGVDSFYCLQEFGFHSVDDRELTLTLTLRPESQTRAFVYNLETHDILADCAKTAGKGQPGLYTLEERRRVRERYANSKEGQKRLAKVRQAEPLPPEARAKRDARIWRSLPPINAMVQENYIPVIGRRPSIPVDTEFTRAEGKKCWLLHRIYGGIHGAGWSEPIAIVYDEYRRVSRHPIEQAVYSWEDYRNHEPLGDTGDRGWGVLKDGRIVAPLIGINSTAFQTAWRHLRPENMDRYFRDGDRRFARDMAFYLIRYAYNLPAYGLRHCIEYPTYKASLPWMARRFYQSKIMNHQYALTYDRLYPFIKDNEELARAVNRFIPWVETPEDVIKLLDTHLVQYVAKNMLYYRYYYDNTSANMMLKLAAIQANPEISEPWMKFLWSRVYYYPFGHQPLPDILSLNAQRDGTSPIGSIAYAITPATDVAKLIEPYMRTGGYTEYDLRDFQKYPESVTGCYWPVEECVAGQWSLNIGDVGGPSIRYKRFTDPSAQASSGWKWTNDPLFAWLLVNEKGRTTETDAEWTAIEQAAQDVEDPLMNARSRVLSSWSGILESGVGNPDFRFHRAAAVRVGFGRGHSHKDALDLRVWAHGLIMSGDYGQRGAYGKPTHAATKCHNVVQIDEEDVGGHSWVRNLADMQSVQYLQAEAVPNSEGLLRRQVALVDADPGRPSEQPKPWQDADVVTPNAYVFDVFRTVGGKMHTYCFHGAVDDMHFDCNVKNRTVLPRDQTPARQQLEKTNAEARYLRNFRWTRKDYMGEEFQPDNADWVADAPDGTLQATWRLARPAEKRMVTAGGSMTAPRKFTRLHLFNTTGSRVLHGIVIDKKDGARINPEYPHYAGRSIYVQQQGDPGLESVHVALIEPYAGKPFIAERRLLSVTPNHDGARRAAAVEVTTTNGRTDVLFAEDRSGGTRRIPEADMEVAAEFAFVAKDAEGLRNISISGARRIVIGNITIAPVAPEYEAEVTQVDYRRRELALDRTLPASVLRGAIVELGDEKRRTSYEIADVQDRNGRTIVRMRKSLEVLRTQVKTIEAKPEGALARTRIRALLEAKPGLWVTNGDYSRFWRLAQARHGLLLDGAATMDDFRAASGRIILLETGVGATLTLSTRVSLQRTGRTDDVFDVVANVPFHIRGADAAEMSTDNGRTWSRIDDAAVPATAGAAKVLVRGLQE